MRSTVEVMYDRIEALEAELAILREQTALAFADFLHTLPSEDGWEVGPARVKFNARGTLEDGPLWATQADTERWALTFLQKTEAAMAAQEKA